MVITVNAQLRQLVKACVWFLKHVQGGSKIISHYRIMN